MLLTYVLIFALFYGKTKGESYQNTSPNNREHMTKQECDKN